MMSRSRSMWTIDSRVIVYAAIGICAAAVPRLHGMTTSFSFVLVIVCAAAAALWQLRRRLREPTT